MQTDHFKKLLLAKRRELQTALRTLEKEGSVSGEADAGDFADAATNDRETSDALDRATALSRTLEEVQDALRRMESGAYGKCTVCGRDIEPERLEAIPWTLYCRQDQEKMEGPVVQGATL